VNTTVEPNAAALTGPVADLQKAHFHDSLDWRVRLIEAVLRLAKINVHLVRG